MRTPGAHDRHGVEAGAGHCENVIHTLTHGALLLLTPEQAALTRPAHIDVSLLPCAIHISPLTFHPVFFSIVPPHPSSRASRRTPSGPSSSV
ncbi:hypothetical protein [Streptomyces sp. NPDC089799]|uniref:hypothetical protein n=1 Tax=Streptomyces sp. NPDC089799 TaxID=3155066 RepID=UPI003427AE0F